MQDKKILIVYYSRTGTTKRAAEMIGSEIRCVFEEIIDKKHRGGALGYVFAGRDAMKKNLTEIGTPQNSPQDFDLVIIGAPVWAYNLPPAVRAYIGQTKNQFKQVALFCTMGSSGGMAMLKDMETLCGKKAIDTLILKTKDVQNNSCAEKCRQFVEEITG